MSYNFANALNDAARLRPDQVFVIVDEHEQYTFSQIHVRTAQAAAALKSVGVDKGHNVGLRLPNTLDFIPYYFGLLSLGAVVFLMNPQATQREIEYIVRDGNLDSMIVLADDEVWQYKPTQLHALETLVEQEERLSDKWILEPVQLEEDATALVMYTSGSTGEPKGVELTHLALLIGPMVNAITFGVSGGSVVYAVLPLYHIYGITELVNASVIVGHSIVLRAKFHTADVFDAVERFRVNMIPAVPTIVHALINADWQGRDLSSVTQIASGGAPISPEHIAAVRKLFPNGEYVEGYGLTETAALGTQNGKPFEFRFGSVGKAVGGIELQIMNLEGVRLAPGPDNIGEIALRGLGLMKGYLGRREETARVMKDGWIRTGDLGYIDEDGYLFITGRAKDLIIRGGFNVYPVEVEHTLETHPNVSQASVVGVPDEHYGEEIVAFIVPKNGNFSADELSVFAQQELSAYKYPRYIYTLEHMPLGPTNKIDKLKLRKLAQELIDGNK